MANNWDVVSVTPTTATASPWDVVSTTPVKKGLDTGIVKNILGSVVDPVAKFASGMFAQPVSDVMGLAATAQEALSPSGASPEQFRNDIREALTYEPRTVAGASKYNPLNAIPAGIGAAIEAVSPNQAKDGSTLGGMAQNAVRALIPYIPIFGPAGIRAAARPVGKMGGRGPQIAAALEKTAPYLDPVYVAQKAVEMGGRGVGNAAKYYAGMKTGTGAEPISQAVTAGRTGEKTFVENMRGKVPSINVLDDAKSNLSAMIKQKQADYRQNMANVTSDKAVLDVQPIRDAVDNGIQSNSFKSKKRDDKATEYLEKTKSEIDDWQFLDPVEYHTPEGLDALKQRVGSILESIPYEEINSRRVIGNVYNEIKTQIGKQAPTYADTMKAYSEASDLIDQISSSLSLNPKTSVDTSMRKLQSLMRNNVNTNYGQRLNLATELENQGGRELRPALAGQALNTFTPRGLQGAVTAPTSYLAYSSGGLPLAIADLISSSPRAVGEIAYKVGQGQRLAGKVASKIPITTKQARLAALLAAQQEQAQ